MRRFLVHRLGSGWVVVPVDWADGSRWYFDNRAEAAEWAEYLERSTP